MRLCFNLLACGFSAAAFAQYSGVVAPPSDLQKGFETISIKDAKRVLTYLATQCDGRGTGQPGYEKAAKFVANEFHRLGLKPLGDNGTYFQSAPFTRWKFDPKSVALEVSGKPFSISPKQFVVRDGPAQLSVTGKPVWIKAVAKETSLGDMRLDGDIVFLESDTPMVALERSLAGKGAVGLIRVVKGTVEASWGRAMGKVTPRTRDFASASISASESDKLKSLLAPLKETTTNATGIEITPINTTLKFSAKLDSETVDVGNVVAEMPGTDPNLAAEYVGIGGHLDHLGDRDGLIYPGADDDGSGSTAVIEIARAMVANPKKPRRSLIFMTFFGEEMGLLGSRFLTDHPPVPLDHMVAELQMDMVGRDSDGVQNGDRRRVDVAAENVDTIRLVGSKRISTELDQDIQDENKFIGFKFKYDAEDVYTRSDHYNFASKGIPIAFLFDGFHPDYHQPTDTVDKIDWLKLTSAAKLYYLTAHRVADADEPPVKNVK